MTSPGQDIPVSLQQQSPVPRSPFVPKIGRPAAPVPRIIDDAYVKRVQRRHLLAARHPANLASAAALAPSGAGEPEAALAADSSSFSAAGDSPPHAGPACTAAAASLYCETPPSLLRLVLPPFSWPDSDLEQVPSISPGASSEQLPSSLLNR